MLITLVCTTTLFAHSTALADQAPPACYANKSAMYKTVPSNAERLPFYIPEGWPDDLTNAPYDSMALTHVSAIPPKAIPTDIRLDPHDPASLVVLPLTELEPDERYVLSWKDPCASQTVLHRFETSAPAPLPDTLATLLPTGPVEDTWWHTPESYAAFYDVGIALHESAQPWSDLIQYDVVGTSEVRRRRYGQVQVEDAFRLSGQCKAAGAPFTHPYTVTVRLAGQPPAPAMVGTVSTVCPAPDPPAYPGTDSNDAGSNDAGATDAFDDGGSDSQTPSKGGGCTIARRSHAPWPSLLMAALLPLGLALRRRR